MKAPIVITLCCLNMVTAGTLYMFSLYGQQFSEKLHYTQTQTNFVAVAGNYGMYLSGPVWGWAVDVLGPQKGCLLAAIFMSIGYIAMALTYNQSLFSDSFGFMSIYFAVVGMGSTCSYMSTISTLAKTFTNNSRGVAFGVPIAIYGLSAFIWTTVGHFFFVSASGTLNIYPFLLFLAVATSAINLNSAIAFGNLTFSAEDQKGKAPEPDAVVVVAQAPSVSRAKPQTSRASTPTESTPLVIEDEIYVQEDLVVAQIYGDPDMSGFAFLKHSEVMAFILSFIFFSGPGLMIINSVGAIISSLYNITDDATSLASLQSTHVSIISIMSCTGRVGAGVVSDFLKHRHISRLWSYLAFGAVMFVGQCLGAVFVDRVERLPWLTVLVGLAYGGVFSVAPTITAEFWGTRRFASNWGWVSWAPAFGGLVCNLAFGAFYDEEGRRQRSSGGFSGCHGATCFRNPFIFTTCAVLAGLVITVALSFSRRRRKAAIKRERLAKLGILAADT
ncbi:major facilitator superfamily domain-containing protein [Jimgerdemannia flammicorona]|nr:major facilitator superfamily domain-containing protein [Jimgerdemannia flammicorona]